MTKERWLIILAYATVYLVWGSTFLAIKFGIDTLPPFLLMAARYTISGTILLAFSKKRAELPQKQHWMPLTILSVAMVVLGSGVMAYVEQFIPSGITALLISITPVWMVFILSIMPKGERPTILSLVGVFIGLSGTALLINPTELGGEVHFLPTAVLLLGTVGWALGSIYSSQTKLALPALYATAWQMIIGGIILGLIGLFCGEFSRLDLAGMSLSSLAALAYLIVFGGLIVFPAYMWLLQKSPPAMVATHAYVNPAVALFLGWLFLDEPISSRTIFAASIIIAAIFLIGKGQKPSNGRTVKKTLRFPKLLGRRRLVN